VNPGFTCGTNFKEEMVLREIINQSLCGAPRLKPQVGKQPVKSQKQYLVIININHLNTI